MKKRNAWHALGVGVLLLSLNACGVQDSLLPSSEIHVISREDGSGTRSAFTELVGLIEKGDGTKTDLTTREAVVTNKTGVVMVNVANDPSAIGYISLGSINDTVKTLAVDGVAPSSESIQDGSYTLARPFYLVLANEDNALANDFISFILSAEGQTLIEENGFVRIDTDAAPFAGTLPAGKITVAGSSSVTPIMEKLREAYLRYNTQASIEIQMNDSSSGISGTSEGLCEIGMSSRELTEDELQTLRAIPIALDGIVMVVHHANPLTSISVQQVQHIYLGTLTQWDALSEGAAQ